MSDPTPILTDAEHLRDRIRTKAVNALASTMPLPLRNGTLEVKDLAVVQKHFSPVAQYDALMREGTLQEAVKGTLVLKDKDGNVVDTAKNFTLTHLPWLTERHTLILGGNEYQVANQLRRKPGVYTARADNGELRAIFNLGRGSNFNLGFTPDKGTFHIQLGTSNIPLYPVLRAAGVSHDTIVHHLGEGVANANRAHHGKEEEKATGKLYAKLEHPARLNTALPHVEKVEAIRKLWDVTTLDPHVTQATLGTAYGKVTPDALLTAARKVLDVHGGHKQPDDTDALTFKTFHSLDDFLHERIKLSARQWAPKAKLALATKSNIRDALRPAPFSESIRRFITTGSLAAVPTAINPLELIDHAVKVTSLGEGGIPSDRAIPLDARMIHNTHFGALDPIRTPESSHSGVDIRATLAAHRDDQGNLYTVARNVRTGKDEFLRAGDLKSHVVAFPGETLKGHVDAFLDGKVTKVPAAKVTHQIAHVSHLYSPATTLLPLIHGMQGNRAIMASKMGTQALPLLEREAPFVQSKSHLPGEVSFEALYGHMIAPRAPVSGKVVKIEDGFIHIRPHDAEKNAADRPTVKVREFGPFTFHVEIAKGEKPFGHPFPCDYGYLPGYVGPDGDSLDFWVGTDKNGALLSVDTEEQNTKGVWVKRDTKYIVGVPTDDVHLVLTQMLRKPKTRWVNRRNYASWDVLTKSIARFKDEDDLEEKTAAAKNEGLIKVPYSQNFPFPSKTMLHHTLDVKPGDTVVAGQRLGDSNYTKNGVLALGRNLRVAYVPYYGLNSNDAVVISEGCAKKLTSEHVYREVFTIPVGMEFSKERHQFYYGTKYTPQQYGVLDAHGVVRKGARVQPKDILVCGLVKTPVVGTDALLGRISKALAKPYQEVALTWNHGTPGEVMDVVRTGSQIAVLVRTIEQMQVGDKLAGRFGNKGVVAKILPDAEMLKDEGGNTIDLLLSSAGVISRCYDAETEFLTRDGWRRGADVRSHDQLLAFDPITHSARWSMQRSSMYVQQYSGPLYCYESKTVSLAVTPGHTMYARPANTHARGGPQWRTVPVDRIYGHDWEVPSLARFQGPEPAATPFLLPGVPHGSVKNRFTHDKPIVIAADVWAEFLGWFLSEGHTTIEPTRHSYKSHISQSRKANPEKVAKIAALLARLPFTSRYQSSIHGFVLSNKQLTLYLAQFGYAREKYIPEWLFQQPHAIRQLFLDALWAGDGHIERYADGRVAQTIGLTSERLIDDIQRLLYLDGVNSVKHSCKVKATDRHRPMWRCGVHLRSSDNRLLEKHNWSTRHYEGRVYCPSVETGFVVTRRSGKILVAGNTNPSQVIETAVGKVVEKTGKPILFDNNTPRNLESWASTLLKAHGVKDKEHLYDPVLKRHIKGIDGAGVLVGRQFIYKLFKSTDTNFSGHGVGPYDLNEQPLKTGGEDSAKGIGKMEFDALIAHNARNFLHEASTIKGQKNDEFWKAVQLGLPLPAAKSPFVFKKFVGMLEGAGLKVDQRGSKFRLLPLTDKDVLARSTGAIKKPETLIAKNLKPEPGGLFDPRLTGGPQGTLYAHIELPEPIPNPVFKEPVRRLLGLTEKGFDEKLQTHGGAWFHKELQGLDTERKLKDLHAKLKTAKGADLNDTVKQIKYLNALNEHGYKPHEAYVVSKVPVVPPVFRPIIPQPNNPSELMVADANKLYKHLMDSNHTLQNTAVESDRGKHRRQVFNAVAALYGTEDVENDELRGQSVKGFLSNIAGVGTPKGGFFQRKVVRKTQDVSGRGTAVPDPTLGMDQVGIPEQMLWQMYDKLVIARMVRQGHTALEAKEAVLKKTPAAKAALMVEVGERPVMINRAPTLHRWSIVAAYPTPVQGKTIRINPFIEKGMNLDFDGDRALTMTIVRRRDSMNLDYKHDFDLDHTPGVAYSASCDDLWWSLREASEAMTSRIKTMVPTREGERVYLVDLADFPHGEKTHHQETKQFYKVDGVEVLTYDEHDQRWVWAPVAFWSHHQGCITEVVTLASGMQLHTDDDPRAVYGYDADTLVPVRRTPTQATQTNTWVVVGHDLSTLPPDLDSISNPVGDPLPLRESVGRWLGTMVGDGWVDSADHVGLAAMDDGIAAGWRSDLSAIHESSYKLHTYERKRDIDNPALGFGDSCRYVLNDKALGKWLKPLIGSGATNKHLPPFFLRAPESFRRGLLAGLMQTDGCISQSNAKGKNRPQWMLNYATSSNRLAREVALLFKTFGVRATITASDRAGKSRAYTVTPSSPDLRRLGSLTVSDSAAQKLWDAFFNEPDNSGAPASAKFDKVPLPRPLWEELRTVFGTKSSEYATLSQSINSGNGITRILANKYLSARPELRESDNSLLQRWIRIVDNTAIRWDRVISFERTGIKEDGYDLTVPGYETFMNVEGVILSNTLQVHAPVTHAAIEDAKKMTLSNMLLADHTRNKILAFPQHEAIIGFTHASKLPPSNKPVRKFKSMDEAIAAYKRGEIAANDPIELS